MNLFLTQLTLTNFKSYSSAEFAFSDKCNLIYGLNGVGKTNLLDAIYSLAMTQSYMKIPDRQLVKSGTDFYRVEGLFTREDTRHSVALKYRKRSKKIVERNGQAADRLADHIGFIPIVMVTPDDIALITGGSALRRNLIDRTISQADGTYLEHSLRYARLLKQRNSLLKQFHEGRRYDETLMTTYDQKMAQHANYIYESRISFLTTFKSVVADQYKELSAGSEQIDLHYLPSTNPGSFLSDLQSCRSKDRVLGRTTIGPHTDKLDYLMGDQDMKIFASQGQKKSAIFSTKLAQYAYLSEASGYKPILILDDIFDRIDRERSDRLLQTVLSKVYGQIFISDTEGDRMSAFIGDAKRALVKIEIKPG